jgi:hypothetical protein
MVVLKLVNDSETSHFNFVILEKFLVLYSIPKIGLGTFCHIHILEEFWEFYFFTLGGFKI